MMQLGGAEGSAKTFLRDLEAVLSSAARETRTLVDSLRLAPEGCGAEAVSISKSVCEEARALQKVHERLLSLARGAPSLTETLDSLSAALDERDIVLDAFEKYLQDHHGIEPLPKSKTPTIAISQASSSSSSLSKTEHWESKVSDEDNQANVPGSTPELAVMSPVHTKSTSEEIKSMPKTPRMEDFLIDESSLGGLLTGSGLPKAAGGGMGDRSRRTQIPSPLRASLFTEESGRDALAQVEDISKQMEMLGSTPDLSAYGIKTEAVLMNVKKEEMDGEGDDEEEDITEDFLRRGPAYTTRSRGAADTPSEVHGGNSSIPLLQTSAARGISQASSSVNVGMGLGVEETPRMQTRRSVAQEQVIDCYERLPAFIVQRIDVQTLVQACQVVESGGPNKIYAKEEIDELIARSLPGVNVSFVTLALTKARVLALHKVKGQTESAYRLIA